MKENYKFWKVLGHLLYSVGFQCCMLKNMIKRDSVLEKLQRGTSCLHN